MSLVTIPVYHYALLKGYLAGQNAPSEVLAAVEALHLAAVEGPLRADALDAIQAVREAAEKLLATAVKEQVAVESEESTTYQTLAEPQAAESELPDIAKRALEKASVHTQAVDSPSESMSDEAKVEAFLKVNAVENCPPAHASGTDQEMVVGIVEPKKRKEWSPEPRAAAAERMRARQAVALMGKRSKGSTPESVSDPQPMVQIRKASKLVPDGTERVKVVLPHF